CTDPDRRWHNDRWRIYGSRLRETSYPMGEERLHGSPEARPHHWRTGLLRALLRFHHRPLLGKVRNECPRSGFCRIPPVDQKEAHPATPWETALCSTWV